MKKWRMLNGVSSSSEFEASNMGNMDTGNGTKETMEAEGPGSIREMDRINRITPNWPDYTMDTP
ncbi:hypothetical protein A2U01_0002858 [Trifolium medium]|uniref:Uncharacterized protein n=1 Tax=Trifolium medium TaxID=97028 RepID=A0A392M3U3_9FABA|nr:hypothetical protein [Trifolium medium]